MSAPNWDRIYHTPAEGVVAIAVQCISIVILSSLLVHFLMVIVIPNRKLPKMKRNNAAKLIRILCISCFAFSILYCISNLTFHSVVTFTIHHISCDYRSWTIYLLMFQRICLYWFYLQRLKVTFQHSLLRIRQFHLRILYILSGITILSATIMMHYFQTYHDCSDLIQSLYIIPAFLLDIFWCLFLSIWFVLKLQQSIVEFQNDGEINQQFVLLMCKLTNIILWSSFILQIALWIFGFFTGWIITVVTINVVITCAALLFTFNPYSKVYKYYICCLCHQCIIKWCKIKVEGHIKNKISEKLQLKKLKINEDEDNNNSDKNDNEDIESPLVAQIEQNIANADVDDDFNNKIDEPYHD